MFGIELIFRTKNPNNFKNIYRIIFLNPDPITHIQVNHKNGNTGVLYITCVFGDAYLVISGNEISNNDNIKNSNNKPKISNNISCATEQLFSLSFFIQYYIKEYKESYDQNNKVEFLNFTIILNKVDKIYFFSF